MSLKKLPWSDLVHPSYLLGADTSYWNPLFSGLVKVISTFMILSFVGALMDEKGGGAAAAISSRFGMASTVRQAEER